MGWSSVGGWGFTNESEIAPLPSPTLIFFRAAQKSTLSLLKPFAEDDLTIFYLREFSVLCVGTGFAVGRMYRCHHKTRMCTFVTATQGCVYLSPQDNCTKMHISHHKTRMPPTSQTEPEECKNMHNVPSRVTLWSLTTNWWNDSLAQLCGQVMW